MITSKKSFHKVFGQEGTSAVEFAICLPLLVFLIFGIIEFSILLYDKAVITNASREGARAGIVYAYPSRVSDTEIKAVVINYCQENLVTFGSDVLNAGSITVGRTGDLSGDPLTVTVSYNYDFLVMPSFINSLLGGIQLSADTVMRME